MMDFNISDYKDVVAIGYGGYSRVFQAVRVSDSKVVSIKKIKKDRLKNSKISSALLTNGIPTEYLLQKELDHPGIPKVYSLSESGSDFFIILEYIDGDILSRIPGFTPIRAFDILRQLIEIGMYLFEKGIAHRDFKLENIIVDKNFKVFLIDYGLAIRFDKNKPSTKIRAGTDVFYSPEMFGVSAYDPTKADIWSLGIIFHYLLTGDYAFHTNFADLKRKILQDDPFLGIPIEEVQLIPKSYVELVRRMLAKDCRDRPSLEEILESECFSNTKVDEG